MAKLKAPFIYFGGKSSVAGEVWRRFGRVANYIEPFFGSGAVLLQNPHEGALETVNDLDGNIANFWRAVQADPDAVAEHADWPVNELDLHARHRYLMVRKPEFVERVRADPHYFDAKTAGWWVWGINAWIGSGWCGDIGISKKRPHLGNNGKGIHKLSLKIPHLGNNGQGIHKLSLRIPHLGDNGKGIHQKTASIHDWFSQLSKRLRRVRVCCGDWSRITGPSVTFKHGLTSVFLDPPYAVEDRDSVYNEESFTVAHDVRNWCIENGNNPLLRIALCGYEEHDELESRGWTPISWKANGGYSNLADEENENKTREVIWFSPHCIGKGLFE